MQIFLGLKCGMIIMIEKIAIFAGRLELNKLI